MFFALGSICGFVHYTIFYPSPRAEGKKFVFALPLALYPFSTGLAAVTCSFGTSIRRDGHAHGSAIG